MVHETQHHEGRKKLAWIASPLHDQGTSAYPQITSSNEKRQGLTSISDLDLEQLRKTVEPSNTSFSSGSNSSTTTLPVFENTKCDTLIHDSPTFHHYAEATTAELFYDLFFVANLTTFTSEQEVNDRGSLTDYIGFVSLLWLTWYQVTLYDVRFSTDSVFERFAKAVHFGVMVGFAVIGPQWRPGQLHSDYRIYVAFGYMLMVSRFTLLAQYGITLWYTKEYRKTVIPLALVLGMCSVAAIIYGALTPAYPATRYDASGYAIELPSNVYIAWYIIGLSETILSVGVSCYWRVVSFKGTHMVQRMSLLTLIVLGEGIIVICKSISRIVKNNYLWSAPVVAQIIAGVLIIYFLYMLYFDRIQEEHFGTIKQQIWSFLHFPLHIVLVLVLQGVSLLIIWRQAVESLNALEADWLPALNWSEGGDIVNGSVFASYMEDVGTRFASEGAAYASYLNETCWDHVYNYIPRGVDASREIARVDNAYYDIQTGLDNYMADNSNNTAWQQFDAGLNEITSATFKTLFDTFRVSAPSADRDAGGREIAQWQWTISQYYNIFDLVFTYTFIAVSLAQPDNQTSC